MVLPVAQEMAARGLRIIVGLQRQVVQPVLAVEVGLQVLVLLVALVVYMVAVLVVVSVLTLQVRKVLLCLSTRLLL
jgi:hypothetical protein